MGNKDMNFDHQLYHVQVIETKIFKFAHCNHILLHIKNVKAFLPIP
jgi:hypothetical protein